MPVIAQPQFAGLQIFQQLRLVDQAVPAVLYQLDVSLVDVIVESRFGAVQDLESLRHSDVLLILMAFLLLECRIYGGGHEGRKQITEELRDCGF